MSDYKSPNKEIVVLWSIFFKPLLEVQTQDIDNYQSFMWTLEDKSKWDIGAAGLIYMVIIIFWVTLSHRWTAGSFMDLYLPLTIFVVPICAVMIYVFFLKQFEYLMQIFIYIFFFIPLAIFSFLINFLFFSIIKLITFFTHYTENSINSLFSSIEKSSNILQCQKQKLLDSLENGTGFYDFQKVFSLLSRSADSSIINSHKLEKLLKDSKFHDIFDFEIYHSWIRKQVREPLEQILNLMEDNLQILKETKEKLVNQITETIDQNLRAPLELQLVRMDEQIGGFERNRPILREYFEKLKN